MTLRAYAGGFLISLAWLGCGDDSEPAVDTITPDTVEVSETTTEVDGSGPTGEVDGRWAMLETQTALVTTQLLGTQVQTSQSYYLADLADGQMTVTLCDWLTEDASKLTTTRMGDKVLGSLGPFVRAYSVTPAGAGFDFTVTSGIALRGVTLTDLTNEAMPTEGTDARVIDQDEDDKPGITLIVQGTVNGALYVAHRHIAALDGALESDTRISGLTDWTTEQVIFGSDPALISAQKPVAITHPDASLSHFVMVKVGAGDDCAAIKAQRATLFP